ncbi:hypothetical protein NHX12_029955, partial [Muraenolepis orangiensis]
MSVSLATDIRQEGESGPLTEPCSRGKGSPQPQATKDGTPEGLEPDDAQRRASNHSHSRKRPKSNAKLKLVRSLAVCEESSGPFSNDGLPESDIIQLHISCPSDKEEEKSSKEEYENEEKEKKDKTPRKMLSRDSISGHHTEKQSQFINDDNNQYKKFPQMTSYHRMLLHRVAAYFGMDHNVDQTGKAVIINKTGNTRMFSEHIKDERNMDFQKKFILKRDDASMDKDDNQIRVPLQDGRRSKSIEEREEEYQRVRDRIFARESSQNGYINDNRLLAVDYDRLVDNMLRRREKRGSSDVKQALAVCGEQHQHRGNRESSSRASSSRQSSTDSDMKCLEPRPWSSTDSDSSNRTLRPPVTKASSFSGISILTRGDSLGSNKSSQGSCRGSRSGLPLVSPDLCPPIQLPQSSRGLLPCPPQPQQPHSQPPQQTALLPTPQQHPMGSHMMAQPPQSVSYSSPTCPQVLLPVSPPQQYTMFSQMTLSRQGSSENPDAPPMYQAAVVPPPPPPTVLAQHATPQTSYIMATAGPPMAPPSGYQPAAGHPHPPPPPPPPSQPVMQAPPPPQGYMQPPPPQQIQVSYYPPGQYPGHQAMMPSQQPSYQGIMGVQAPQNPGLINSQRASMGGQMQSMMVQYQQMPSYQVSSVQGPMPVYYSVITPTQQTSTSPSVGYLQPPSTEQYQITQSPSPCTPQQIQQQYSGVPAPGPGVMVMQLSVPNGPQPSQNPPLVQWNPCKFYSIEQRPGKPGELYKPENSQQASTQLFPRPGGPAQGDGRYSLLGQPLQYSLCPPPLMHGQPSYNSHQGQGAMKHGARGKKQTLKSQSTDLGTGDVVVSRVLEVTDLPEGISRPEAEKLVNQLSLCGARIHTMAAQSASFKLNSSGGGLFKLRAAKKNYDLRILERASS